jgi:hypothetical protein
VIWTLVFLWSLTCTAPALNSGIGRPCPLGCRDTSTAEPCVDLAKLYVVRHRQSPSWVVHRAAILGLGRLWPLFLRREQRREGGHARGL